jgi:hypothetical protein
MAWLTLNAKATDDADWAVAVDIVDDDGEDYDATDLEFRLNITEGDSALLTAGTEAGYSVLMTRPATNQIAWRFTKAQMATLCPGKTYKVGCVHEDGDGNITQFIVGELAMVDGGMGS